MTAEALVQFARSRLEPLLGLQLDAWFFLAGGAFKSLLHGRPPRDLDLWPATSADRIRLEARLRRQGAQLERENAPFHTAYAIAGECVEVAHDVSASSMEERIARSDLALSAIGVEHREGAWRGIAHPLALQSIRRQEVLLLWPLANWKYALATLERMRRYALELGFTVPEEEERAVWELFRAQPRKERSAMVARYLRVSRGDPGILTKARTWAH